VCENRSVVNGRLLLAGRPAWFEHDARDLLDVAEALVEDEARFRIGSGLDVRDLLPNVDLSVPFVIGDELVLMPYEPPAPSADDETAYDPEQDPFLGGAG
jgi:hypothetical protein